MPDCTFALSNITAFASSYVTQGHITCNAYYDGGEARSPASPIGSEGG